MGEICFPDKTVVKFYDFNQAMPRIKAGSTRSIAFVQ